MYRHRHRNFRFIGIMFWAFPYLLWQTFGHWSGFFVGLLLAIILTVMLNNLFRPSTWNLGQQPAQMNTRQQPYQQAYSWEPEPYQQGYRAEAQPRPEEPPYQVSEVQPSSDEMQLDYPEMPPMQQQ